MNSNNKQIIVEFMEYNSKIQILLGYHTYFGENADYFDIETTISQIPREMIFNFICVLCNKYNNKSLEKIDLLDFREIHNKVHYNPQIEFIFCTEKTCLEILRYSFSKPSINTVSLSKEYIEELLVKLVLAINEKITWYKVDNELTIPELDLLFRIINPIIKISDEQEINNRVIYQLKMSMCFFEMLTSNEKYANIYNTFLNTHNVDSWEKYLLTILGVVSCSKYKVGYIDKKNMCDKDEFITKSVLDSISLSYNDLIKYSSENKNDRCCNDDYRVFRAKPIVIKENGDYFIHNIELLTDCLFNSLYFEFKSYEQNEAGKIDINELFTDIFCEKTVFDKYIECSVNINFKSISESECKKVYLPNNNELGAPDYIIYNESSIFLFECKDIRINGKDIETHNYDKIIKEFKNKLYKKENEKNVGITQLTGHIKSIRERMFKWVDNTDQSILIYPVLVLSDYKNVVSGFNNIANEWYKTSLSEQNIMSSEKNRPLIVMSFITLFKYHSLFQKDGFAIYFEKYIELINSSNDLIIKNITFDEFMAGYPYQIEDCRNIIDILKNE